MERITFDGNFCDIAQCRELQCPYNGSCTQREVWERLKAYEETGMTPEGVEALKLSMMGKAISEITEFEGLPIDRLKELVRADKEGRIVVLPCKVGDAVYIATRFGTQPHIVKRVIEPYFYTVDARNGTGTGNFSLRDFGEIAFLTRAEALRRG